jgi:phosphatidylglycerophosphate synthase
MAIEAPSIKELRALCQATAPNPARESIVGRISRIFSIYLTRFFISTSITPNQITVMSVLVFFAGITSIMFGGIIWGIAGSVLIFVSIILDGCDGEIARYKKNGGPAGTLYVEPVSHDIQYGLMFPLLGLGLYLQYGGSDSLSWIYIVVGFIAGTAKLLYRLLEIRMWDLVSYVKQMSDEKIDEIKKEYDDKSISVRFVYWVNKNVFSSTGVFIVLFLAILIGRIDVYLYFYATGYIGLFVLLFAKHIVKIARKKY